MKKALLMLSALVAFCFISVGCGEQKTEAIAPDKIEDTVDLGEEGGDNSATAPEPAAPPG